MLANGSLDQVPILVVEDVPDMAREIAAQLTSPGYLARIAETGAAGLEAARRDRAALLIVDCEWRMAERRIRTQPRIRRLRKIACLRFPAVKRFDTFYFPAIPPLNNPLVLELARRECRRPRQCIDQFINMRTFKLRIRARATRAGSFGQDARRREDNFDQSSLVFLALDGKGGVIGLGQGFGQRQAKPGAARRPRGGKPPERFESHADPGLGHANPGIANANNGTSSIRERGGDNDLTARLIELHRVRQ